MKGTKLYAMLAAMFMAGAFVASPELRAYAANTVFSADIVDGQVKTPDLGANAVTSPKIKDGEVKAADIATGAVGRDEIATDAVGVDEIAEDSVGEKELMGVTKLIFASCPISLTNFPAGGTGSTTCNITRVLPGDKVITTFNADSLATSRHCMVPTSSLAGTDSVIIRYRNACASALTSTFTAEIIVFKT